MDPEVLVHHAVLGSAGHARGPHVVEPDHLHVLATREPILERDPHATTTGGRETPADDLEGASGIIEIRGGRGPAQGRPALPERIALADAAINRARALFNKADMCAKTLEVYDEVLARASS